QQARTWRGLLGCLPPARLSRLARQRTIEPICLAPRGGEVPAPHGPHLPLAGQIGRTGFRTRGTARPTGTVCVFHRLQRPSFVERQPQSPFLLALETRQ